MSQTKVIWQEGTSIEKLPQVTSRYIDQTGLKLRDMPASGSQVLELKVCATMPSLKGILFISDWWKKAQPTVDRAIPGLVILGSTIKQAEQAMRAS